MLTAKGCSKGMQEEERVEDLLFTSELAEIVKSCLCGTALSRSKGYG